MTYSRNSHGLIDSCGSYADKRALLPLIQQPTSTLVATARTIRDRAFGNRLTYSPKVFLPLTQLCRDVCHYCTFAKTPKNVSTPYMSIDNALAVARKGADAGCTEALFTLGERPEARYKAAADWLRDHGYESTIHYVADVAGIVLAETGLLPHINAGTLSDEEIRMLRPVAASVGIMLESSSTRLAGRGMPHYGSPDKAPAARLATLRRLGEHKVPTTTGILIGIGETEEERIKSLQALYDIHDEHAHIQEIIVQNFRAKPGTRMAHSPEPTKEELLRTIAHARLTFGTDVSIQVPPNLNKDLPALVDAGIDDWGGISPVTIDFVNPEAPWPHIEELVEQLATIGKVLTPRLTIYPRYVQQRSVWLDPKVVGSTLRLSDAHGLGRDCPWVAGTSSLPSPRVTDTIGRGALTGPASAETMRIVDKGSAGTPLSVAEIEHLFEARGADLAYVCRSADELRRDAVGDVVTYVVTRNINYTNVCTYHCKFCAFSKGKTSDSLRGSPYIVSLPEIARRTAEAWERGATEVCMQGGIHPDYTGDTYLSILQTAKAACPSMHVHAFSPLEVSQGASTLGIPVETYLAMLKDAGLGSLPGTAAEILDDEVRRVLCPDKLSTDKWLQVIEAAHRVGLRTTSTIMFGHVDRPVHWARHLAYIRNLQDRTQGFTEFVPLPFVATEAPIYRRGRSRRGPTFREAVLMHAVARIAFHTAIPNIQASWVKLGPIGVQTCLEAGVNDVGGTLMNESITRAAGAMHGQEAAPETLEGWILGAGRVPQQRTTLYRRASEDRRAASFDTPTLGPLVSEPFVRAKRTVKAP